jgi:hypothetical protein
MEPQQRPRLRAAVRRSAVNPVLTIYCPSRKARRAVKDWHESRETLVIDLEPCGHMARRTDRLEWLPVIPARDVSNRSDVLR